MTSWMTQDVFASLIALGAAITVLRRVGEFAWPAKSGSACASCGTGKKSCARPAGSSLTPVNPPLLQITRRAS